MVIPDFGEFTKILTEIFEEVRDLPITGAVADYIPALAVSPTDAVPPIASFFCVANACFYPRAFARSDPHTTFPSMSPQRPHHARRAGSPCREVCVCSDDTKWAALLPRRHQRLLLPAVSVQGGDVLRGTEDARHGEDAHPRWERAEWAEFQCNDSQGGRHARPSRSPCHPAQPLHQRWGHHVHFFEQPWSQRVTASGRVRTRTTVFASMAECMLVWPTGAWWQCASPHLHLCNAHSRKGTCDRGPAYAAARSGLIQWLWFRSASRPTRTTRWPT
jgi:hypothetical protein